MSMSTGAKVAIGCGCIVLLGGAAVLGVIGAGAWWAKGKVANMTGGLESISRRATEIESWEKKANAYPYDRPADGVISEARLLKFLEVREEVYAVYQRYENDFRELEKKSQTPSDKLSFSDVWSAGGKLAEVVGAIRLAQVKALAGVGMSEDEYRDIQLAVYKTAWASDVQSRSGRMPSDAVSQSMSEAATQMQDAVRAGLEAAKKEDVPGAGKVSPEDVAKLQQQMRELGHQAGEAFAVPEANVRLFRRHEAEIRKYAMHGLAFIGL
jgi:hypothetical protein